MKNIVTIGGGTGSYMLLCGLKKYEDISITAIVSMADDGGSTGRLRDELGVLPSGDVRQCLVGLSENTETIRTLMNYRFEEGSLKGHSFGNMFLAALEKVTGSFTEGVEVASDILKIKGKVVPITKDTANLMMELRDGDILIGENSINHGDVQTKGLASLYFQNNVSINPHAREAIEKADTIIIGPGNIYCSILPNLIVEGFREAINTTQATIILPINLTNKKDHTSAWKVSDYVLVIEKELGRKVDYVILNNQEADAELIKHYESKEGTGVLVHNDMIDERIILAPILSKEKVVYLKTDAVAHTRSFIRHDSDKLAEVIISLI